MNFANSSMTGKQRVEWPGAMMILVLLGGCTSLPVDDVIGTQPAPGVRLGEEILLLDARTERVATQMTADGRVHLVAITPSGDARYLAIGAQGVEQAGRIGESGRYGYYSNLAIADDGRGRVHVVLRDEHWILEDGAWTLAGENRCALLARAADSLVCAQVVDGKELATLPQWGVTGFGGFGAGIIIPYRIRPDKLVLATWGDHGWEHQAVIEHGSDYSINTKIFDDAILSGDARGTLSLLYRAHIGPSTSTHYTQIALDQEARRTVEWRRPGQPTILLADIPARDAGWLVPFFELAFAVDPQGGATAFLAQQDSGWRPVNGIVVEREWPVREFLPVTLGNSRGRALAPAGEKRFHALFTLANRLIYLSYGAQGWSQPTRLGEFGTPSLFLIDHASVQLASNGRPQALVVWPRREGRLVGRWIELNP